jgi:hypothetical protein
MLFCRRTRVLTGLVRELRQEYEESAVLGGPR